MEEDLQRLIELITADVEVGRIYEGKVVRLMDFGAFVAILPGRDGLVHISQISEERVEKVFAIQAGREIRVIVMPDDVDDARSAALSEEIARRVEAELQYPGQIKVVVIRETRAVDFAR